MYVYNCNDSLRNVVVTPSVNVIPFKATPNLVLPVAVNNSVHANVTNITNAISTIHASTTREIATHMSHIGHELLPNTIQVDEKKASEPISFTQKMVNSLLKPKDGHFQWDPKSAQTKALSGISISVGTGGISVKKDLGDEKTLSMGYNGVNISKHKSIDVPCTKSEDTKICGQVTLSAGIGTNGASGNVSVKSGDVSVNVGTSGVGIKISKKITDPHNPETDAYRNCAECHQHYNKHNHDGKCPTD